MNEKRKTGNDEEPIHFLSFGNSDNCLLCDWDLMGTLGASMTVEFNQNILKDNTSE